MRRSRIIAFAVVASWCAAVAVACGLDEGGTLVVESIDGSIPTDGATLDGQIVDGRSSDSQTTTDGGSDGATGPDGATPKPDSGSTTFLCAASLTQVANCAADCPSAPHDCPLLNSCVVDCFGVGGCGVDGFQCDACGTDGGLALSRCESGDAAAFSECLVGLNRCACPGNDVSKCVGMNQTCENNECFECGEVDAASLQNTHPCEKPGTNNCHITSGTYGACY